MMMGWVMFAALVILVLALFLVRTIGWCLLKLRLLIPVIYVIVWFSCRGKDWFIIKLLDFHLIKDKLCVGDIIGVLMLLYAAVMFIHDVFAPIIERFSSKRRNKCINEEDEYIVIMTKESK